MFLLFCSVLNLRIDLSRLFILCVWTKLIAKVCVTTWQTLVFELLRSCDFLLSSAALCDIIVVCCSVSIRQQSTCVYSGFTRVSSPINFLERRFVTHSSETRRRNVCFMLIVLFMHHCCVNFGVEHAHFYQGCGAVSHFVFENMSCTYC